MAFGFSLFFYIKNNVNVLISRHFCTFRFRLMQSIYNQAPAGHYIFQQQYQFEDPLNNYIQQQIANILLMFKVSLAALLASAVLSAKSMNDDAPRFLQAITTAPPGPSPTPPPTPPDLSSLSFSAGSDGTSQKQHSPKLTCFSCIMNDYVYCQQGPEHPHVKINGQAPQGVCCESTTQCPQLALDGWACSNSYTDKLLSLRLCPFDHSKCGTQSEIVLSNPGESVGQNLTLYPGDLCFFTMRAECGLPAFNPQGLDMITNVDVYTIEYDDTDVDAIIVSANDTEPTIPDPLSRNNTKMTPRIPLPKKEENFDGQKKDLGDSKPYLLRYQVNVDGTTTYFYSNGSAFSYESCETTSFDSPDDTRLFLMKYSNGTNVTVYKDGTSVIIIPGRDPIYVAAPLPPPPSAVSPAPSAFEYEKSLDNDTAFGGRRMQALPPTNAPSPPGVKLLWNFFIPATPPAPTNSSVTPVMPSSFNLIRPPSAPAAQPATFPSFYNWAETPQQNNTVPILSEVWGTVVFYLDGRIRELKADGTSAWILDFYNKGQNPNYTSPSEYNNTAFLKARVFTNGSYVLSFSNGEVQRFLGQSDWNKFYFTMKPVFKSQIVRRQINSDGSVLMRYVNNTIRYNYPPVNSSQMTPYQRKTAILYDELITGTEIVNRYYVNGTIAQFENGYFQFYINQPSSLASDMTSTNFTDGSFAQYFEVSGKKIFYYPPPPQGESTYNKAQAIYSLEDNRNGATRIVFRNGTVAIQNNTSGVIIGFEVPPTSWQPSFEIKYMSACQWEEIDYTKDTRNVFYCLPNSTWTAFQNATSPKVNMTLRDGTRRFVYLNGTVARMSNNNTILMFEVYPKSIFTTYATVQNADGSSYTNYSQANLTVRFVAARMTPNNTPFEIATAIDYRDVYENGLERIFYVNGTVGVFNSIFNGTVLQSRTFVRYDVSPTYLYDGCERLSTSDGSRIIDCTFVNNTVIKFYPPRTIATTGYENAVAPAREVQFKNTGMTDVFYRNGTAARFNESNMFQFWIVAPVNNTLLPVPTDTTVKYTAEGIKQVFYNGILASSFYPPTNINTTQMENFTGILYQEFEPLSNLSRVYYRNGSNGVQYTNGTFVWRLTPNSFYVPFTLSFNISDGSNITSWRDGNQLVEYPRPPASATDYEKSVAMQRREIYAQNNTEIQYFYNLTIAEFRNGSFFGYIAPPRVIWILVDTIFNIDGSQTINYSNGTINFIGAPPVQNETLEQFAGRIIRAESNKNGSKIVEYANGTIAVFQNGSFSNYRVPPKSLYVSRQVDNQADGSIKETFSNGTIRTTFAPPSPDLDDLEKSRYMTFEDLNILTDRVIRRYLNGTVAIFSATSNQFLSFIGPAPKFYIGCVLVNQTDDGDRLMRCQNNTLRLIPAPLSPQTASLQERACEIQVTEWFEGSNNATIFYKNGTITLVNQTDQALISYIQRPEYFWSDAIVTTDLNGDIRYTFDNGTIFFIRSNLSADATPYQKATAQLWFRNYQNGTTETKFVNGTHIRSVVNSITGIPEQLAYIRKVDGNISDKGDNSISIDFANGTSRLIYPPLAPDASDYDKAISPEYKDTFLNGSSAIKFLNGTVVLMSSASVFKGYIIPPKYFYGDIIRTNFSDGSYQLQYLKNMTVRYFVSPLPTNATKKDRALALLYIDKFTNGTMKRAFANGTIAVYQNNILVKYDVKPSSFFDEDSLDTSIEDKQADGSRVQYFNNNTVRYYDSPEDAKDRLYKDCFSNSTCIVFFKNGSRSRFDGDNFVWNEGPAQAPAEPRKDPNYNYVNKTGPKIQSYDRSQGGIKKYKEDYQNEVALGQKSQPDEPICKGRNQMIIMGDLRIKSDVYPNATRILQIASSNERPSTLALQVKSIGFIPEIISSGSFLKLTFAAALFAFNVIMF